jgi:hypothetical protein
MLRFRRRKSVVLLGFVQTLFAWFPLEICLVLDQDIWLLLLTRPKKKENQTQCDLSVLGKMIFRENTDYGC